MITRNPLSRDDLHINAKDYVLEVGPGHSPTFRANVLSEKLIYDNSNRCGDLHIFPHQKLVHAPGEELPFKDKEFDYVVCNHVLEHADDPAQFIEQLTRVAKRGYVETPSLIGEYLFPQKAHKWLILYIDNKLVFFEKSKVFGDSCLDFGELFLNYLPWQSIPYKLLWYTDGDIMLNRCEWKDSIDYIVNPQDEYYQSFFTQRWDRSMSEKIFPPRSLKKELVKVWRAILLVIKSKRIREKQVAPLTYEDYVSQTGQRVN